MMFLVAVTLVSLLVAVIMSVVAWRVAGEARRRSDARVAALAADIHSDDLDLRDVRHDVPDVVTRRAIIAEEPIGVPLSSDGLFAATQPEPSGSRYAIALAAGVIVVGAVATLGLLVSSGSRRGTTATAGAQQIDNRSTSENGGSTEKGANANPLPLELVALGHDRDGDRLTVRGVVRNPVAGATVERLTAVVLMFNRDGDFLGSGRATVESPALGPGGESTFVVTVPNAAAVGRYRVSFRTEDRIVPHVDRREHALARS